MAVAFIFPTIMGAHESDIATTDTFEESDSIEHGVLMVTLESVTGDDAEVTVLVPETSESEMLTVTEGENESVEFDGGNVTISNTNITGNDIVTLRTETPATFGWSDAEKTVADNLSLLIALAGFIMVLALAKAVIV